MMDWWMALAAVERVTVIFMAPVLVGLVGLALTVVACASSHHVRKWIWFPENKTLVLVVIFITFAALLMAVGEQT